MNHSGKLRKGARLELSYLHGGEVVYQPGETLGPRSLNDFELVYIIEGTVTYETADQSHTVAPGGFILGRPGNSETYRWDPRNRTRHAFFHFGINHYPSDWLNPDRWPQTFHAANPICADLFRHILQHMYEHDEWPTARLSAADCRLVETLLDMLLETPHTETTSFERERPEPVRRALMHIRYLAEEDPDHPLSLHELADQANVTEKHLCRLFAKWVGHSPMQTYTLLRLESALPLLTRTNLSIKEAAQRCGFANALYFSRIFSKTYGCSPSMFRTQLNKGLIRPMNILPVDIFPRIRW